MGRLGGVVILVVLGVACGHGRPLSQSVSERLEKVAVVVRREAAPTVYVGRGDPGVAATLEGSGRELDVRLEENLSSTVTLYELEELVRSAFVTHLGEPPWTLANPLEVASLLGLLLARERQPDWRRLQELDIDAVFDITVTGWGLWDEGPEAPTAGWMEVKARLLRIPSRSVMWSGEVRVNPAKSPVEGRGEIDLAALREYPDETLARALTEVADEVGAQLAGQLGADSLTRTRPE